MRGPATPGRGVCTVGLARAAQSGARQGRSWGTSPPNKAGLPGELTKLPERNHSAGFVQRLGV
eukprot:6532965-Lingulodinium_polyedra.AAC.1